MVAQKNALAAGFRVSAHDGMIDGRPFAPLRLGHGVFAVPAGAREVQVVHCTKAGDARLPGRAQALVAPVHVAEMGFTPFGRGDLRVEDRGLTGDSLPGAVGVPHQRAAVGVLAGRVAVLVQVGQAIELAGSRPRGTDSLRGSAPRRSGVRTPPAGPAAVPGRRTAAPDGRERPRRWLGTAGRRSPGPDRRPRSGRQGSGSTEGSRWGSAQPRSL